MKTIDKFIYRYRYYIYVVCVLLNIYGALKSNPFSLLAIGWCFGLLFCSLVNDDIV